MKTFAFLAAMMAATTAGIAHAEERRISVVGTGTVVSMPDMATITLGVTNKDEVASDAMQATSDTVAQVLSRLTEMGLEPRDVQTRDLSLSPIWSNVRDHENSTREIVGFVASNRVFIRVRDLDRLGKIMDAVITDGANDFGGLSFSVQDPKPLQAKARAEAVKDAREKAEQLAEAAGIELGQVLFITDHSRDGRPVAQAFQRAVMEDSSVPIAEGEVSVSVSVSMEFEISE